MSSSPNQEDSTSKDAQEMSSNNLLILGTSASIIIGYLIVELGYHFAVGLSVIVLLEFFLVLFTLYNQEPREES